MFGVYRLLITSKMKLVIQEKTKKTVTPTPLPNTTSKTTHPAEPTTSDEISNIKTARSSDDSSDVLINSSASSMSSLTSNQSSLAPPVPGNPSSAPAPVPDITATVSISVHSRKIRWTFSVSLYFTVRNNWDQRHSLCLLYIA